MCEPSPAFLAWPIISSISRNSLWIAYIRCASKKCRPKGLAVEDRIILKSLRQLFRRVLVSEDKQTTLAPLWFVPNLSFCFLVDTKSFSLPSSTVNFGTGAASVFVDAMGQKGAMHLAMLRHSKLLQLTTYGGS